MCLSRLIYSAAVSDLHYPCRAHAMLWPCHSSQGHGTVRTWHERGMASVNQTRPHCVNQMGKAHSKTLRGTAWAQHGHGMLCVNRPGQFQTCLKRNRHVTQTLWKATCSVCFVGSFSDAVSIQALTSMVGEWMWMADESSIRLRTLDRHVQYNWTLFSHFVSRFKHEQEKFALGSYVLNHSHAYVGGHKR
jgi:hypothetical protein